MRNRCVFDPTAAQQTADKVVVTFNEQLKQTKISRVLIVLECLWGIGRTCSSGQTTGEHRKGRVDNPMGSESSRGRVSIPTGN